jgi:hypothetical protein
MFTDKELNLIIQLLDIATKAGGLAVAERAMPLVAKIHKHLVDVQAENA